MKPSLRQIRILKEAYDLLDWVAEHSPENIGAIEFTIARIRQDYGLPAEFTREDCEQMNRSLKMKINRFIFHRSKGER